MRNRRWDAERVTVQKLLSYLENKFPWRVTTPVMPRYDAYADAIEIPWVLGITYDYREPFAWCLEHAGPSAILGEVSKIGRRYTMVEVRSKPAFASVTADFFFRDQTIASAFRLIYG
jgi:hypothetical protein